jgi:hypothetical protein
LGINIFSGKLDLGRDYSSVTLLRILESQIDPIHIQMFFNERKVDLKGKKQIVFCID